MEITYIKINIIVIQSIARVRKVLSKYIGFPRQIVIKILSEQTASPGYEYFHIRLSVF